METSGKLFIKLVRLVARVFYDNYTTDQLKSAKGDSKGIAVVVLDALTRRQWVREEDLAKDLKLHAKQLRKIIRHFEEQKLVMRYHGKETAKRAKMYNVAVAATTDGRADKLQTHSYCCLDYSQIYDIVRCKLHRIKKKLKDELEDKNTVEQYGCPNCKRKYNALDAMRLICMEDDSFHCENCNGELVVECNKLTSEEAVGGDKVRRQQQENLKVLLQNLEVRLEPLMDLINRLKHLPFPAFESFPAWEARAAMTARENGDLNPNDPSRSQGVYGSTPMPFFGETKVEVNLGEGKEDVKSEVGDSSLKVLPPWMITQRMDLTQEQRGETVQETNVDDKKSAIGSGNNKDLEIAFSNEYLKAYHAALVKQQELARKPNQQESADELTPNVQLATTSLSNRQVGMKSKREEDVELEEEEASVVAEDANQKVEVEEELEDFWEEG